MDRGWSAFNRRPVSTFICILAARTPSPSLRQHACFGHDRRACMNYGHGSVSSYSLRLLQSEGFDNQRKTKSSEMASDSSERFVENLTDWPPRKKYICTGLHLWGPLNWSGSSSQQINPTLAFLLLIRFMDAAFHVFVWHLTILRLPGYTAYKTLALGYLDVMWQRARAP